MYRWLGGAAVFAALMFSETAALAQDVTLRSRDGALVIEGTMLGFDGEFYRIDSRYGPLTLDAEGAICEGPGCPDLTATLAVLQITGAAEPGLALLPRLLAAYAQSRGLSLVTTPDEAGLRFEISDKATGQLLARIGFHPAPPEQTRAALQSGAADLAVSLTADAGFGATAMALDALVPVMAGDNGLAQIATPDLAAALAGEVVNWRQIGGPDMPIVLHALNPETSLQEALAARLGRDVAAASRHDRASGLAEAVARDPWALAITGLVSAAPAKVLGLTDSCGFPLVADRLSVKAGDYPLAMPVWLLTPRRRLPLFVREFLEFLDYPAAQQAIADAGYVDRSPEIMPMLADGRRLLNAIRGAGDDIGLKDLKQLAEVMAGASRSSLTFRFEDGSSELDARSRETLDQLVALLEIGAFRDQDLILAGFSDATGEGAANLALSADRATEIAQALQAKVTDLPEGQALPRPIGFGEALPMACDSTAAGRRSNRRVELWLKPATTDSDVP